ncbi:NAD(P)-dependent alcohol dehydrogenase [Mycobacterium sp. pUA109]|uniref:NAD(P)-dependent alcohol dehydrogenase n=1 Tax=Mycobacterium sp. pUA109 TaxID=3238982 RepID=UPI00351ACEC6
MRARAAISTGPDAPFDIRSVDVDDPRADEILVKLSATGICHTDLFFKSKVPAAAGPCLFGHEGVGVVTAVGPAVTTVTPGDHVVLSYRSCGDCRPCRQGQPAYCDRSTELNALGVRPDGAPGVSCDGKAVLAGFFGQSSFAEYALAHPDNVVVVDAAVDKAVIAALGCGFQTGAGAVLNVLRPTSSSQLVIYGTGSVGFAALLAARAAGVERIVAVDPAGPRRELATELGAVAVDPTEPDAAQAIASATDGGATHALDTTGIPAVIRQAAASLRATGALAVVGLGAAEVTIDIQDLLFKGKTIRGCIEGDARIHEFIPALVDLYAAGTFPIDRLITRYRPEEFNQAIADQADGRVIKPVIVWDH